MSHSFIVLSAEPESNSLDWAEKRSQVRVLQTRFTHSQSHAKDQTVPLCPLYVPNLSPFELNQTLIVSSLEAVNSKSPSLLKTICVSERS